MSSSKFCWNQSSNIRSVLNPAIGEIVRKFPAKSSLAFRPLSHNHVVLTLAPCHPMAFSKSTSAQKSRSPV
ncbi:MAG: hypothetical protein WCQ16_08860 [Verrucomicrobiae bacterium]